jgi:hypothetical protein
MEIREDIEYHGDIRRGDANPFPLNPECAEVARRSILFNGSANERAGRASGVPAFAIVS